MSDESQVSQSSTTDSSNGSSFVRSQNANDFGNSAPVDNQSSSPNEDKSSEIAGQGEETKVVDDAKSDEVGQGQKAPEKKPEQGEKAPFVVDQNVSEFLKAKGVDPTSLTTGDGLVKLVDMYKNIEREHTKLAQKIKAEQTLKEAESVLPKKIDAQEQPKLTPMQEFEEAHQWFVNQALERFGVGSFDDLIEVAPKEWSKLQRAYQDGLRQAQMDEQNYHADKARQELAKQQKEIELRKNFEDAEFYTKNNLAELKRDFETIDEEFEKTGVNNLLKWLEDTHTLPKTYVLSNPVAAKFLAQAAKGMALLRDIESHNEKVRQEYDKQLKKQSSAKLVDTSTGDTGQSGVVWRNTAARGVSF